MSKSPTSEFTSSVGIVMLRAPAGSFTMGSPESEDGRRSWERQREVTFGSDFYLGKTPVTQAQDEAVTGTNPTDHEKIGDAPADSVWWKPANEYCQKLTKLDREAGVLPEDWEYRLPTEAEWEYACRADTSGATYGPLDSIAWHFGNADQRPHPVCEKSPNPWGFYDMLGNVWEVCQDWFSVQGRGSRAGRGGSYFNTRKSCRAAARCYHTGRYGGFRLLAAKRCKSFDRRSAFSRGGNPAHICGCQCRRARLRMASFVRVHRWRLLQVLGNQREWPTTYCPFRPNRHGRPKQDEGIHGRRRCGTRRTALGQRKTLQGLHRENLTSRHALRSHSYSRSDPCTCLAAPPSSDSASCPIDRLCHRSTQSARKHGARLTKNPGGNVLEFANPLQYAEFPFDRKLDGIEAMTVGGWFYPRRSGEQYFLSRGVPEIGPLGERFFRPNPNWVNFVLGTDQQGFLLGTINGNGSMPFAHVTVNEVPINSWSQLVVVKDKQGFHKFYRNAIRPGQAR